MRTIGYVVSVVCMAAAVDVAHADSGRVALLTAPSTAGEYQAALQLTLRGVDIAALPQPAGTLRLDRAADAQRATLAADADAGVWIEYDAGIYEVCVVSSDGRAFRHAPLPTDGTPRVFAAIATSLLDELLAPPEAGVHVDVQVNIGTDAGPPPAELPPGAMPVVEQPRVLAFDNRPVHWDRTLVELGPMVSPLSIGVEVNAMFPVTDRWRFGAMAFVHTLIPDGPSLLLGSGLEARRVGRGHRHFDIGFIGGAATAGSDPVVMLAARLGIVWEGPQRGLGLSVSPTLVLPMDGGSMPVIPAVFASLHWVIPV